jgi:8-oxo-dGTP pyrophosphatase MutT (NUDIX family)
MVNRPLESCGALIYCTTTKRYLFLLRNSPGKYSGTWGLVGGKIESAESVTEALSREIREELGGIINGLELYPIEVFVSNNKKFTYHTFLTTVDEEFTPLLNGEHRGYCWVELKDHPRPLHPGVWRTFAFESVKNKISTVEDIINILNQSQLQTDDK